MRKRRGLSTVVGAVFFVIAVTTTIAYVSYSMNSISNFSQSVIVLQSENTNRGNEQIEITSVTIDGGKFNITVVNTGSLVANLTRLWVANESLSPPTHEKGDLNQIVNFGDSVYNIGQNLGISASSTEAYTLKVVTGRGNFASHQVFNNPQTLITLISPGAALPDKFLTVTGVYVNNSTVSNTITDLTPTINLESGSPSLQPGYPKPSLIKSLSTNDVELVTWLYKTALTDQTIQFNASYTNAPAGVWDDSTTVVEGVTATTATSAEFADEIKELSVLALLPNPMRVGATNDGKYSAIIFNPLNRDVDIGSLSISSPSAPMFNVGQITAVEPTTGWRAEQGSSGNSFIVWESDGNPITVQAKSIKQFRVEGENVGEVLLETDIIITVITSDGKLSDVHTMTAKDVAEFPTMNVYYSPDYDNPETNWTGFISDIPDGVQTTYNATVQSKGPGIFLGSEVVLTIIVPKDFTSVSASTQSSWDAPIIINNADGSTLIKVNTTDSNFNPNQKETFSFNATAPVVTEAQLYVFKTIIQYPNSDAQIAAAIAEAGVRVVP